MSTIDPQHNRSSGRWKQDRIFINSRALRSFVELVGGEGTGNREQGTTGVCICVINSFDGLHQIVPRGRHPHPHPPFLGTHSHSKARRDRTQMHAATAAAVAVELTKASTTVGSIRKVVLGGGEIVGPGPGSGTRRERVGGERKSLIGCLF